MSKVIRWSITAALAGFLFGFDTVVISGADRELQNLWGSSDLFHGTVVMAMALWGTVIGAMLGSIPTDKFGRKKTLIAIGILYAISALGSALANDPIIFAIFRFIGGLGVGGSTIATPAYISEIAPTENRGKLVAFYQFNIVFGILVAFLSNYFLAGFGDEPWRLMLGVEFIPSLIFTVLMFWIPESPRWLLVKNENEQAKRILQTIYPGQDLRQMLEQVQTGQAREIREENIYMKKYRLPLILAFLIAFFNQFSGINAFLYYAPRIFEEAGLGQSTALLSSIGIGVTNLIFTLIGLTMIDMLGRRTLMIIGSIGYIISLSMVAMAFFFHWDGLAVPAFLFLFIASHAIGQGAVIWVFISEIFPNHLRGSGQSFGSSVHWILAAIIPSLVPVLFTTIGAGVVFAAFAIMMCFQLLFVLFVMPETSGKSLEELEQELTSKNQKTTTTQIKRNVTEPVYEYE